MARISLMDFGRDKHKGLWIMGPRERTPSTHMRRLSAVESLRSRELRSRYGTTGDASVAAAHSLHRFDDVRYQGATTVLYKAAVSIDTGYDGTPLEFDVSEPRTGTAAEYLFVSGGGKLTKVDTSGTVTQWGIDPPDDGNWGISEGTGESTSEVTVTGPQTTTIVDTAGAFAGSVEFLTGSGFDVLVNPTLTTDEVASASGSAYCANTQQSSSTEEEGGDGE